MHSLLNSSIWRQFLFAACLALAVAFHPSPAAAQAAPKLSPGSQFSIEFPDMPPTFRSLWDNKVDRTKMTVFLPSNYDPGRKHPLLIFLSGGNGSYGRDPKVARAIAEDKDFVCVDFPLFKAPEPSSAADAKPVAKMTAEDYLQMWRDRAKVQKPNELLKMTDDDYRMAWPLYRRMLAKLDEVVPNIDPAHRVLGGFSNGAHTTGGVIEQSNGEASKMFCAFFFVEGGGRTQHYELIKGQPLLILHGDKTLRPERVEEIRTAAESAGVKLQIETMPNTGHAFPEFAYPVVRSWLYGTVLH